MAKFVGTVEEFHNLLGPRIRDVVGRMARDHRVRLGEICESCGAKAEVRTVHVHGHGLRLLIEAVLSDYMDEVGFISCDIDEAEVRIIEAHMPEGGTFRCLCHACREAYESGGSKASEVERMSTARGKAARRMAPSNDSEFHKLRRIKLWASRPGQINHRIIRGFLALEHDGGVEYHDLERYCEDELGVPIFYPAFAQMKTDAANAHGKVFYVEGSNVRMWDRARAEVEKYFGRVGATRDGLI